MKIVQLTSLMDEFRTRGSKVKGPNELVVAVSKLKQNEALVISAKEADKWKNPANTIRSIIRYGQEKKHLSKTSHYAVSNLKSGSYAISCISK